MFGLLLAAYSSAQKAVDAEERTYDQGKHCLLQPGHVTIIHKSQASPDVHARGEQPLLRGEPMEPNQEQG